MPTQRRVTWDLTAVLEMVPREVTDEANEITDLAVSGMATVWVWLSIETEKKVLIFIIKKYTIGRFA